MTSSKRSIVTLKFKSYTLLQSDKTQLYFQHSPIMKRTALILLLIPFYCFSYGQIIADHTVVEMSDKIPQEWINEVKKMCVTIHGRSHATEYVYGADKLATTDPSKPASKSYSGPPQPYTDKYLRISTGIRGTKDDPTAWEYGNEQHPHEQHGDSQGGHHPAAGA